MSLHHLKKMAKPKKHNASKLFVGIRAHPGTSPPPGSPTSAVNIPYFLAIKAVIELTRSVIVPNVTSMCVVSDDTSVRRLVISLRTP